MGLLDIFNKSKTDSNQPPTKEEVFNKASEELRNLLAPSGVKISSQEINISGKIAKSFFVISYPRYLNDA